MMIGKNAETLTTIDEMMGTGSDKENEEEKENQPIIEEVEMKEKSKSTIKENSTDSQDQATKNRKVDKSMSNLELIPMAWIKLPQTACLFQILHLCMLIETQRDTS